MSTSLADWLGYIESLHPRDMELGLERVAAVARQLGLLPWQGRVVTVAGTNGKGSTVSLLDHLARASGWRTGLYTSPHIHRFNERIRIDGAEAADDALCRAFEDVEAARRSIDLPLTYFEFTTLAGLLLFREAAPDLLILEVGLGGRLDAVNIVDPDVAVITSVGLDHTDWLGDTREAIASEKAGIRRPGRPLLYGEEDMPSVVAQLAAADGVPLLRAGIDFGAGADGLYWQGSTAVAVERVWLGEDNLATAAQMLALLGRAPDAGALASAARLTLPGRCQQLALGGVDWCLDVGHNREALARFLRRAPAAPSGRTLAVCAMLGDKPVAALAPFVPVVEAWFLADLDGERGGTAARLAAVLPGASDGFSESSPGNSPAGTPPGSVACYTSVAQAVAAARAQARPGDRVLVFGSFYTVADAQAALLREG